MISRSLWMKIDLDGFRRFGGWSSMIEVVEIEVGRKGRIGRKRRWWEVPSR